MPKDILNGKIDESSIARVSINHVERLSKHKLSLGDIIYGRRGDIGRQALVREENVGWLCGSGCLRISLRKAPVDPKFLHLYLKLPEVRAWVENQAIGATMPNLNTKILRSVPIRYPANIDYQQQIVAIVSTYDDLIENNDRRITLLEKMAEEIYHEWFVRLRFPGHEQVTFHKGIPEGWNITRVKDFGRVITGKTPSTQNAEYYSGFFPFIKTPDMHGNVFVLQTEETLSQAGLDSQKRQTLSQDSICVNCIGALSGSVSITSTMCQTNQQINSLVLDGLANREFLFFSLRNLKGSIHLFGNTGSTMTNLSKGKFENLQLLKPCKTTIYFYHESTKQIFEEIKILGKENILLKQTRDRLLTRLISGKLSVADLNIQFPPSMVASGNDREATDTSG